MENTNIDITTMIVSAIVIILAIVTIAAVLENKMWGERLKKVRQTYLLLPYKKLYRLNDLIVEIDIPSNLNNEKNEDLQIMRGVPSILNSFLYLVRSNNIAVDNKIVIANTPLTYFDPVTLYWYIKYRTWIKRNENKIPVVPLYRPTDNDLYDQE